MTNIISLVVFLTVLTISPVQIVLSQKIPLSGDMVRSESGNGDASLLVDEQNLVGDPAKGAISKPLTSWFPGWGTMPYPAHVTIDLGKTYNITQIYLYDLEGRTNITVSSGNPTAWKEEFTDPMAGWNAWASHDVQMVTRYLRLTRSDFNSNIPEIVLYGTVNTTTPLQQPEPAPQVISNVTMDQLIGINAFIDDPLERMMVAGIVREYHSWNWDEGNLWPFGNIRTTGYSMYPLNKNAWNKSYTGWNFDGYYNMLKTAGIIAAPCIKESVSWLTTAPLNKPLKSGSNPLLPQSYAAHADHMYQYVARYGSSKLADTQLKLAADQPRNSGLNTVSYFEDWNEQDCWWDGTNSFFSPEQYAAMASADYDGHLGKLGSTYGVKNADKNAKMVMGGLAQLNLNYIKSIKAWADANRQGSFPADVINVHHYCNDGDGQDDKATVGVSPEADQLKEKMKEFTSYRDRVLPGKEVWLSEFGYDTHVSSIFRAPKIGSYSQQEVQGQWIVRSYLELAAAGVDRGMMYMLRDVDPNNATKFSTSGLTSTKETGWIPKISWYYLYTLKNTLKGMKFISEVKSNTSNVNVYTFKNAKADNGAYAVWCPTSSGMVINNYELALQEGITTATMVTLKEGDTDGIATALPVTNGKVKFNVSERPVFILTSAVPPVTTGMNTYNKINHFKVFPGATRDFVTVSHDLPATYDAVKVQVYDNTGKLHSTSVEVQENTLRVDFSTLPTGLYYMNLQIDDIVSTQKVVKY